MARKPTYEELEQRVKELEKGPDIKERFGDRLQTLSLAIEQSSEGIAVVDMDGNLEYLNDAFAQMHGYSAEELIGKNLSVFHTIHQMTSVEEANRAVKETGEFKGEIWHIRRDGTVFPTMMHNSIIRDNAGKPIGILGTLRDISDIKHAEEALRESEEKFSKAFFSSAALMAISTLEDGRFLEINDVFERTLEYKRDEIIGKTSAELDLFVDIKQRDAIKKMSQESGYVKDFEIAARTKSGAVLIGVFSTGIIQLAGKPHWLTVMHDITNRKQMEKTLLESEEKYRLISENATDVIWVLDAENQTIEYASPSIYHVLGFTDKEIINRSLAQTVTPASLEHFQRTAPIRIERMQRGDSRYYTDEIEAIHKDGHIVSTEQHMHFVENKFTGRIEATGVMRDITKRKQAEEALRESEEKFRKLFDTSPNAIALTEVKTGKLIDVNDKLCRLAQATRHEILGRTTTALGFYSEADRNRFISELNNSGKVDGLEMEFRAKDGSTLNACMFAISVQIKGEAFLLTELLNITEQKRLETLLLQAQKMEAIGTLAGGIAHDYNNLMSIIMGNLSMAMEEVEPGSDLGDFLNEIDIVSRKIRDLTHKLMSFSRGGKPVKEVGPLNELLKSALDAIPADSRISVNEAISPDLWHVPHDSYKTGAAIRNVVTNGVEAMPDGGMITIKAENLTVENKDPSLPLGPGDFVHISIQDQGKGIPEEQMDKIFDPYFSSKERGVQKGMGLGLATAYAIIKQHGGHIQIDSSLGAGTTVNIYLPAKSGPEQMVSTITSADKKTSPVKRVLVMDDEEMLRNLARQMLVRLGYMVETVKDGLEAIEKYKQQKDTSEPFDAVILDLTIKGGMGGEQTIREFLKIDPQVKAIVSSGYFNDPVMSDFKKYGFMGALAKPYKKKALKEALEGLSE